MKKLSFSAWKEGFMDVFPWMEQYSIGIRKIDEQHKQLVGHLNSLYEALHEGKGKETLGPIFSGLIQYTKTHFAAEEGLMKLHGYPDYEAHRDVHNKMTEHVLKLNRELVSGGITSPIQIANFLKDWLSKHIMETDKKYGPFLRGRGVA
jgi:hemerythrin